MAKAPSKKSETTVTRIKATDSSTSGAKKPARKQPTTIVKQKAKTEVVEAKAEKTKTTNKVRRNPFSAMGAYFKGSWYEVRQVRWPDRRATWGMTGALIAFTAFFIILILLIDFGFAQLFNLITGKS